jgi:hypothetical protein
MNETQRSEGPILTRDSTFSFACHADLPCFTQCCRDVNIYLTPYDILKLRRALGISSGEVLEKYTRAFLAGPAQIPFVQLLMDPETLYCRLVTEDGCSVYDNRPWACRMYPLDPADRIGEYRIIVGKERCLGLKEAATCSVGEWLHRQGLESYGEMDAAFQAVMSKDVQPGSELAERFRKLLCLVYDIDRFAAMIQGDTFQSFYGLDEEVVREALEDDEALLRLAFDYIRAELEAS